MAFDGDSEMEKSFELPPPPPLTEMLPPALWVADAAWPLTVKLPPFVAEESAESVSVALPPAVMVVASNEQVTPVGRPETVRVIFSALPLTTELVTVTVALRPAASVTVVSAHVVYEAMAAPFGVPPPVGPSKPAPAVQKQAVLQVPFGSRGHVVESGGVRVDARACHRRKLFAAKKVKATSFHRGPRLWIIWPEWERLLISD